MQIYGLLLVDVQHLPGRILRIIGCGIVFTRNVHPDAHARARAREREREREKERIEGGEIHLWRFFSISAATPFEVRLLVVFVSAAVLGIRDGDERRSS